MGVEDLKVGPGAEVGGAGGVEYRMRVRVGNGGCIGRVGGGSVGVRSQVRGWVVGGRGSVAVLVRGCGGCCRCS